MLLTADFESAVELSWILLWQLENYDEMALLSKNFKLPLKCLQRVKYCTANIYKYPSKEDEFNSRPQYPVINLDPKLSEEREWYDKIKRQLTVEEKLFEVNVPRYWGWKCFMVNEGVVPYNNLAFSQHMTRTHIIECEGLPSYYGKFATKSERLTKQIKNHVIDSIEYQLDVRRHKLSGNVGPLEKEKELTKVIVNEMNRAIINTLQNDESHLKYVQTDFSPRIEASWKIKSLVETVIKKENEHGIPLKELPEEYLDQPSDKYIQYIGQPILQLRHFNPLPHLINRMEGNIFNFSVPVYEYDPHISLGYELERRHVTNIPGFWPGDEKEFSFLSYHYSNHTKYRPPSFGVLDAKEAVQSQAIFASFGWLMSVACYQGFSSYHDVTYPLVTQTVLTNGQEFTFATYQLNTTELYHENPFDNPKCNICWITPKMSLFEVYEDGKLKGFNEEVLRTLLLLYINSPGLEKDRNLKPYLGERIKYVADYEDDEKSEWLEKKFKQFSSNRPKENRRHLMYEVYDWERIFKIQFSMRPYEARKRPFELLQNPYHQKMSEDKGDYIPKKFRPDKHLPKWRQRKFKRTFYPQ